MTRFVSLLLAGTLVGCGAGQLPQAQSSEVQAEIRAAEVARAAEYPEAELHLKLAKDQLEEAKALAKDDEMERARLTLSRARVDAELALALARNAEARAKAEATLEEMQKISQR